MEPADLLLNWMSERAEGTLDGLRDTIRWLFGDALTDGRWFAVVDGMSDLGHLDLDRTRARWTVAPAVVNYLPPRSTLAALCGGRTTALVDRVRSLAESEDAPDVEIVEVPQRNGPEVFLMAGERSETAALASLIGVPFVDDAADRMANQLVPILGLLGPGSNVLGGGDSIRVFDTDELDYRLARDAARPGLYRLATAAGPRFVFSPRPGNYHDISPRLGTYLELSRMGRSVIRYAGGDMWVPRWLPLPDPHRRCLALCTGFLPEEEGDFLRHEAIPEAVADKVARSLGQRPSGTVPTRRR